MAADLADSMTLQARQLRALANPTRVRLWTALGPDGATISQLSNRLRLNKGSVSHHLGVLTAAGLVRRGRSRTVRGGTEQYIVRTATRLVFEHERGPDSPASAVLRQAFEEIDAASEPHVHLRTLRLTPAQAVALEEHLDKVIHSLRPADERHLEHGVVAAVYRKPHR